MAAPTVACVLRSGGIYTPDWVRKLKEGVATHLAADHRFVCLSDVDMPDVETVALEQRWPGWWSKLELFRSGVFDGPVLYIDLDCLIVGPLDDLFSSAGLVMCEDFYRPQFKNSSVMSWAVSYERLYHKFKNGATKFQWRHDRERPGGRIGDQAFIEDHTWDHIGTFPAGRVISYKRHVQPFGDIPDGSSIIAFHGRPKPPEVNGDIGARWLDL